MASSEEIYFVGKCNIKIYPVAVGSKFKIESDVNGNVKRFEKLISQNEINDAIALTIKYYYKLLKDKK